MTRDTDERGKLLPEWEDPRVQIVYEILCDPELNTPPNPEEHWEGWVSRNIVAALSNAPSPSEGVRTGMRSESTPELIERARQLVLQKPSTSYVQRHLLIGYNHACELMEHFEAEGLISKKNNAGLRTVLQPAPAPADTEDQGPDTLGERP